MRLTQYIVNKRHKHPAFMGSKLCSTLLLFIIIHGPGLCQRNMVPNSSFESIKACPVTMNQVKLCERWFPFGTADPSPDLFHSCAEEGLMSVPSNIFGQQEAHSGGSYIGLIAYLTSKSGKGWRVPANHREYAMVQLTKPLVKGNSYYAEMWVSLAENCEFSINSLGMMFTEDLPGFNWMAMDLGYYKPQVQSDPSVLLANVGEWVKVSGTFVANGNELALTIGNFTADKNIQIKKTGRKYAFGVDKRIPKQLRPMIAYYFIDDVKVTPVDPNEPIIEVPVVATKEEDDYFGPAEVGKKFVLDHIYFEFDKSVLLQSSFAELDKLIDYMNKNIRIKIEIEGHTDNIGSYDYNAKLSNERAKAVADYLIQKGVNEFRVDHRGYGSTQPRVSNATPEGRAQNRRVEFLILEN